MSSINIFHTRIDNATKEDTLRTIAQFVKSQEAHQIATINAEFLLEAAQNEDFRNVLNACDLTVVDAVSLHLAFWKKGALLKDRYPGSDLMWDILQIAQQQQLPVYLIAHKYGLSSWRETADVLVQKMPDLSVRGADLDPTETFSQEVSDDMIGSAIVFCNFGAPYQEIFLHQVKNATIPSVRAVMGVGGSFDFITGKLPRAPRWMCILGFEWFYRLIKQPWRWRRIVRATIIFPLKVLLTKI